MSVEELDRLGWKLDVVRRGNETDEELRRRIIDRMHDREPPKFRVTINTDKPELSKEILPF